MITSCIAQGSCWVIFHHWWYNRIPPCRRYPICFLLDTFMTCRWLQHFCAITPKLQVAGYQFITNKHFSEAFLWISAYICLSIDLFKNQKAQIFLMVLTAERAFIVCIRTVPNAVTDLGSIDADAVTSWTFPLWILASERRRSWVKRWEEDNSNLA